MGGQQGYSKITTNNLVFAYDVGDQRNSYKGKPAYNVATSVTDNVGNNNSIYDSTHYFITTVGTETVNIPALGKYDNVRFTTINNGYTGYGDGGNYNCCPSFYNYGTSITTGVTGNTLYTYSIIYKTETGYTSPNFMYRYEYNGGTYLTEQGVFDTSKRVDLGDGWYWAYNTFTTQATCNTLFLYFFYYQYNTPDKAWVKDVMLIEGDYKIPPLNFLSGNQTRSATQGLLDLTRNNTIDLTNVSYDSNAQITFDGTNDRATITPTNFNITNQFTIEVLCIPTATQVNGMFNLKGTTYDRGIMAHWPWSDGIGYFDIYNTSGTFHRWYKTSAGLTNVKALYHFIVNSSGQMIVKQNTVTLTPTSADTFSGTVNLGESNTIGNFYNTSGAGNLPWAGNIYVFKVYNKALTDGEISQNYNHYKTRFNLA